MARALREFERRFFRHIIGDSRQPLYVYDVDTWLILDVNDAAANLWGIPRAKLLEMTLPETASESTRPTFRRFLETRPFDQLAGFIRPGHKPDGTPVLLEGVGTPISYAGKRARLVMLNDLLSEASSELRIISQREDLPSMMERIADGILRLDFEDRCETISPLVEQLFGQPASELIGRPYPSAKMPGGIAHVIPFIKSALDQNIATVYLHYERSLGRWFHVSGGKRAAGISIYLHDVTDRVAAVRQLENQSRRLEALTRFAQTALDGADTATLVRSATVLIKENLPIDACQFYANENDVRRLAAGGVADANGSSIAARAFDTGAPVISTANAPTSAIAVPMRRAGTNIGVLLCYARDNRAFELGDVRFLEAIAGLMAVALSAEPGEPDEIALAGRMVEVLEGIVRTPNG